MIFCREPSIKKWFDQANIHATKDQEKERLAVTTWIIWGTKHLRNRLEFNRDLNQARTDLLWIAHSVAAYEVVNAGEVYEEECIQRGLELNPELLNKIYLENLAKKPTKKFIGECLQEVWNFWTPLSRIASNPFCIFCESRNGQSLFQKSVTNSLTLNFTLGTLNQLAIGWKKTANWKRFRLRSR